MNDFPYKDFNLRELLAELENDDSWEPDPEVRKGVVFGLTISIIGF